MKQGSDSSKNKHQQLDEEEAQQQSDRDEKKDQQINRDEIIEQLSKDMKKFNDQKKQGNRFQRCVMVSIFFTLQGGIMKIIIDHNAATKVLDENVWSICFWFIACLTMVLYLIVAFKNPGYVTSYVLKGDEFEDDIESMKRYSEKNANMANQKKQKHKIKKSVLSRAASKISRKERITNKEPNSQTLQTNSNNFPNMQPYQQVLDSSNRCTPNNKLDASHNRFVFSNMTTQNFDQSNQNDTVNLDDSSLYCSKPQQQQLSQNNQQSKKVKIIAQFSKTSSSRSSILADQMLTSDNSNSILEIKSQEEREFEARGDPNKVNPLAVIAKKIAQNSQKNSNYTSEGDLSGKMTTANTHVGKQQLIDKSSIRSDEIIISEDDIFKKRGNMRNYQLDISDVEELDSKDQAVLPDGQQSYVIGGSSNNLNYVNQFDAIQEENEEDAQKEEEQAKHNNNNDGNQDGEQSIFHVEPKYCTVCNLEQPLRTKHCRNCNRCVATYDHHCPWVGNCIAEKNRRYFFYFLVLQLIESIWALVYLIYSIEPRVKLDDYLFDNALVFIAQGVSGFFVLMVGSLVFIHLFLASHGMTTWECLSWNKISYMKIWPKRYGSPFAQGKTQRQNLASYFCPKSSKSNVFMHWKMPTTLPELSDAEIKKRKGLRFMLCFIKN